MLSTHWNVDIYCILKSSILYLLCNCHYKTQSVFFLHYLSLSLTRLVNNWHTPIMKSLFLIQFISFHYPLSPSTPANLYPRGFIDKPSPLCGKWFSTSQLVLVKHNSHQGWPTKAPSLSRLRWWADPAKLDSCILAEQHSSVSRCLQRK